VVLSDPDRRVLLQRARSARRPHLEVLRAAIVLAAAEGMANAAVARWLGVCVDSVRKWRARFCPRGLPGLGDRPRPGRPRIFPATAEAEVKALSCALPAGTGVPLAWWSCAELAAEAVARGVAPAVSASTVGRWLAADAIPPMAAPVVDLPPRSGLRRQGSPGAGPLRPHLARAAAGRRRVRAQRG
jgi:transposase